MPEMNGVDIATRITADCSALKALLMSGLTHQRRELNTVNYLVIDQE
jgi:hypothetical protein